MRKSGFTLVEIMISLFALTVMIIAMCRFSNIISIRIGETTERCDSLMTEYQDVSNIRTSSSIPEVNHPEYLTLVESSNNMELWKYTGEYLEIYKVVR